MGDCLYHRILGLGGSRVGVFFFMILGDHLLIRASRSGGRFQCSMDDDIANTKFLTKRHELDMDYSLWVGLRC